MPTEIKCYERTPATMHPLDNVIWHALTSRQTEFAEAFGEARRFLRDVTSLTAILEPNDAGYRSLAGLVGPKGTAALFLDDPFPGREGWTVVGGAPLLQMVCDDGFGQENAQHSAPKGAQPQIVPLGPADSPEMMELTALTKPGPFGSRTHELGDYLGIRHEGKLVAMAGERLKVRGHTEISAVCTHPGHSGHGYAASLMMELMTRIRRRGEIPILHVRADNVRAIAVYERLGFHTRIRRRFVVVRRD
jgi:FR47-like protein